MKYEDLKKILARNETIKKYCMLIGCYEKYCEATKLIIDENHHSRYENREKALEFLGYITPAVERFCDNVDIGKGRRVNVYKMGIGVELAQHPINIAIAIKHGRSAIKDSLAYLGCHDELKRVYTLMKEHNMVEEQ